MRVNLILFIVLLLSGCEANDPRPQIQRPEITILNNQLCIIVPAEDGEYLNGLEFTSSSNMQNRLRRNFSITSDKAILLSDDKCIPDFGYPFIAGNSYGVLIESYSKKREEEGIRPTGKNYIAYFTITVHEGKLTVNVK